MVCPMPKTCLRCGNPFEGTEVICNKCIEEIGQRRRKELENYKRVKGLVRESKLDWFANALQIIIALISLLFA